MDRPAWHQEQAVGMLGRPGTRLRAALGRSRTDSTWRRIQAKAGNRAYHRGIFICCEAPCQVLRCRKQD